MALPALERVVASGQKRADEHPGHPLRCIQVDLLAVNSIGHRSDWRLHEGYVGELIGTSNEVQVSCCQTAEQLNQLPGQDPSCKGIQESPPS